MHAVNDAIKLAFAQAAASLAPAPHLVAVNLQQQQKQQHLQQQQLQQICEAKKEQKTRRIRMRKPTHCSLRRI
jgi:hypothetical protein